MRYFQVEKQYAYVAECKQGVQTIEVFRKNKDGINWFQNQHKR